MKRFGNLYHQIASKENIVFAFENAARGKRNYRHVVKIRKNPDRYLHAIHEMLNKKTFENSEYIEFERVESGKLRHIHKLPFFPDRIIQHAVCQVLEPIWEKQYIRDTYSCIKGRGIHDGVKRIKKALRNNKSETKYCLKLDIKKYYPSVDRHILKQIIRRKIKCKDTLWLIDTIIDSTNGLPIGNYTSQHFANLYLSPFDHFVKEHLKARFYYRYCDDLVFLSDSKATLQRYHKEVSKELSSLKLTIKPNWQIFPVDTRGIDFLGYRFFHSHTLLRKGIAKRFKKRVRQLRKHENPNKSRSVASTLASYYGWMKYANCYNLKTAHEEIQ